MKTNAARVLDKLGIAYEVREYPVDPENLAAENVAEKIGMPLGLFRRSSPTAVCRAPCRLVD